MRLLLPTWKVVKHLKQTRPSLSKATRPILQESCFLCALQEMNVTHFYVSNTDIWKIKLCGPFSVQGVPTNWKYTSVMWKDTSVNVHVIVEVDLNHFQNSFSLMITLNWITIAWTTCEFIMKESTKTSSNKGTNFVPRRLFTLYCKLLCDCFKYLSKRIIFNNAKCRKQILKLCNTWKYWWN